MGRYLSVDELKAYGFSTTVGDRIDYASGIDAAEQQIDNMLQRRIELADAASARVFRPVPGSTVLWLDDFTTLASIVGISMEDAAARYMQGCPRCQSAPCRCGEKTRFQSLPGE